MFNRRELLAGAALSVVASEAGLAKFHNSGSYMGSLSITVSGMSIGAVSANSLSGFFNPAGSVFSASLWGSTTRYLQATDSNQFIVATNASVWNQEITTWTRNGCVFLRATSGGTAIYFRHNGETTNGTLEAGIVFGLTEEEIGFNGSYVALYTNANLNGTVTGYNNASTAGAQFTFGCNGFNFYASFNGTLIFNQQQFHNMAAGRVMLQAVSSYGFRDIIITEPRANPLFSNPYSPSAPTIDIRDWGAKNSSTTGTMSAGSNQITVANTSGFSIGDAIIIACGGEAGGGLPGTFGVGGQWPALHYANAAARNADTSQPANTYCYVDNDIASGVWLWDGATWSTTFQTTQVYAARLIPLGLRATITNVAGSVLTLDTSSSVATTNANVYFDNHAVLTTLWGALSSQLTAQMPVFAVQIPSGSWAIGSHLVASSRNNWKLQGAGSGSSTIFSPKGVESAYLSFQSCDHIVIKDFTLAGNAKFLTGGYCPTLNGPSNTFDFPYGIILTSCFAATVQNCAASDHFKTAFGTSFCTDAMFTNLTVSVTEPIPQYVQWQIQFADSTNAIASSCTVTSAYATGGLEGFRCDGFQFINCTTTNASYSSNSSGNFLFDGCLLTMGANSQYNASDVSFSRLNPLININSNISPPNPAMLLGGTIRNQTIIQQGFMNANNDLFTAITVNIDNPNVTIQGTYPSCSSPKGLIQNPNWTSPGQSAGGMGVRNGGTGTVVTGMRFSGNANYAGGAGNVGDDAGTMTVTNCVMDHAASGSGITESGTITNAAYGILCP